MSHRVLHISMPLFVSFLKVIYDAADSDANIIFGTSVDDSMDGNIAITVIATGFPIPADQQNGDGDAPPAKKIFDKFR